MNPLALDKITVWELTHPEVVTLAAELGYQAIGLFANTGNPKRPIAPPVSGQNAKLELRQRLSDTGIRIHNLECFVLQADTEIDDCDPVLECGAEFGARQATAVISDEDSSRGRENFFRLAERADQFGLGINIEFMRFSQVKTLGDALKLVRSVNKPGVGVVVDLLHLIRSGGSVEDLKAAPQDLVRYAQICDGPASVDADSLFFEAVSQRLIPGQGEFPLADFVQALPDGIFLGIEVPLKDLRDQGVDARERARLVDRGLRDSVRRFRRQAGHAAHSA